MLSSYFVHIQLIRVIYCSLANAHSRVSQYGSLVKQLCTLISGLPVPLFQIGILIVLPIVFVSDSQCHWNHFLKKKYYKKYYKKNIWNNYQVSWAQPTWLIMKSLWLYFICFKIFCKWSKYFFIFCLARLMRGWGTVIKLFNYNKGCLTRMGRIGSFNIVVTNQVLWPRDQGKTATWWKVHTLFCIS